MSTNPSPLFTPCGLLLRYRRNSDNTPTYTRPRLRILPTNCPMRTTPNPHPSLDHLPRLNRTDVNNNSTKRHTPLPRDTPMLKHLLVDNRQIHNRKHEYQTRHNREEQEPVTPECREDTQGFRHIEVRVGIHVEKTSREVFDFPRRNEQQQRNSRIRRGPGPEDNTTRLIKPFITPTSQITPTRTHICHNRKTKQAQRPHEEAVDEFIRDEFLGEDTGLHIMRGPQHAVFLALFETETDGEEGGGDEVYPENFDGGEGKDGVGIAVFEGEAYEEEDDLGDVGDEEVH